MVLELIAFAAMSVSPAGSVAAQLAEAPRASSIGAPVEGGRSAADKRRYCVVTQFTGSRIDRRDCRTRAQWMADEKWDPTAK